MGRPNLVVITGATSSERAEIANYLVENKRFVSLAEDSVRQEIYRVDEANFLKYIDSEEGKVKESLLFWGLQDLKMMYLRNGFDVIYNCAKLNDEIRRRIFNVSCEDVDIDVNKLLINLYVSQDVVEEMNKKEGKEENLGRDNPDYWKIPTYFGGYEQVLTLENNSREDLENILREIGSRF
jgi:predicted kinase